MKRKVQIKKRKNSRLTVKINLKKTNFMKSLMKLLLSLLESVVRFAAEQLGVVKHITSTNAIMFGSKGKLERVVFYSRKSEQRIRTRAHHFNIKDLTYWQGRFNRLKAFLKLGKSINFDLADMYETEPEKQTFYNLMISQMSKFWVGGPAPAPYVFKPGNVDVEIGNGNMPDARDVVFTPQSGGKLQITWDTSLTYPDEHDDDILQIMLIIETGAFGLWLPMIAVSPGPYVKRNDGTYTWAVSKEFLNPSVTLKCYCAVKFKAGAELAGKIKGIFKFPVGTTPITLIP